MRAYPSRPASCRQRPDLVTLAHIKETVTSQLRKLWSATDYGRAEGARLGCRVPPCKLVDASKRHGISRLPDIEGDKLKWQKFKRYPIGYFQIDITELRTNEGKLYLFVAIDRTSKFAVAQLVDKANRKMAWEYVGSRSIQGTHNPYGQRHPARRVTLK